MAKSLKGNKGDVKETKFTQREVDILLNVLENWPGKLYRSSTDEPELEEWEKLAKAVTKESEKVWTKEKCIKKFKKLSAPDIRQQKRARDIKDKLGPVQREGSGTGSAEEQSCVAPAHRPTPPESHPADTLEGLVGRLEVTINNGFQTVTEALRELNVSVNQKTGAAGKGSS